MAVNKLYSAWIGCCCWYCCCWCVVDNIVSVGVVDGVVVDVVVVGGVDVGAVMALDRVLCGLRKVAKMTFPLFSHFQNKINDSSLSWNECGWASLALLFVLSLSFSLSHTHTQTHTHKQTHTNTHTHTRSTSVCLGVRTSSLMCAHFGWTVNKSLWAVFISRKLIRFSLLSHVLGIRTGFERLNSLFSPFYLLLVSRFGQDFYL